MKQICGGGIFKWLQSILLLRAVGLSQQFNLPGLVPVNYCSKNVTSELCKSDVTLYVNRLNSKQSIIPIEYHRFHFCSINEPIPPVENLSQVYFGELIRPSPYKIEFLKNVTCEAVCTKTYTGNDPVSDHLLLFLKKGISLNYQHHWIVDNMPVTWCYPLEYDKQYCSTSFPMGCLVRPFANETCAINPNYNKHDYYYPFNHVDLTITYHSGITEDAVVFRDKGGRIISVKVEPRSINHLDPNKPDCSNSEPLAIMNKSLSSGEHLSITYSYSVKFIRNTEK